MKTSELLKKFPRTRYQGSKRKLLPELKNIFTQLSFDTALDGFSGTAAVSYLLKWMKKTVTANDILGFNQLIAKALIENQSIQLPVDLTLDLMKRHTNIKYDSFIETTFKNIYYTDNENQWLDVVIQNIHSLNLSMSHKAIAFFGLIQACLIKRPYNLFHRANLYMRLASVPRSFGNKVTWDRSFAEYFPLFVQQANQAVFNIGNEHQALQSDVFDLKTDFDLVYLDPPYLNTKGIGADYHAFYHFLEGLLVYSTRWQSMINFKTKNKRLNKLFALNPWNDPKIIFNSFNKLFSKFSSSTIVLSYRDPGLPSVKSLQALLETYKKNVKVYTIDYQYVLSPQNKVQEVILVGRD